MMAENNSCICASGAIGRIVFSRIFLEVDLMASIVKLCSENKIISGVILDCIGSLATSPIEGTECMGKASYGLASAEGVVGLAADGNVFAAHLRAIISNVGDKIFSGHFRTLGIIAKNTVEVIVGELEQIKITRVFDPNVNGIVSAVSNK